MTLKVFFSLIKRVDYRRIFLIRFLSNYLILFGIMILIRIYIKPVFYEVKYFFNNIRNIDYAIDYSNVDSFNNENSEEFLYRKKVDKKGLLGKILQTNELKILQPVDINFSIVIPKIAANAKVIKNVNPADEKEYLDKLKEGVAHAKGTYFPGEGGKIFLFAHSTDYIWNIGTYNAVFYLLYKLDEGDKVYLIFNGKVYEYVVFDKKVVDPKDVEYLVSPSNEEVLILQTCWPPGTTWKRLLIFARSKTN